MIRLISGCSSSRSEAHIAASHEPDQEPDTLDVRTRVATEHARVRSSDDDVSGLEVSRGGFLQDRLVQRQVRHHSLQPHVLALQLLQPTSGERSDDDAVLLAKGNKQAREECSVKRDPCGAVGLHTEIMKWRHRRPQLSPERSPPTALPPPARVRSSRWTRSSQRHRSRRHPGRRGASTLRHR